MWSWHIFPRVFVEVDSEKQDSEGKDVCFAGVGLVEVDLGRHVEGRAELGHHELVLVGNTLAEAEVGQFEHHLAIHVLVHQQIIFFDVSMHEHFVFERVQIIIPTRELS